MPKVLIVTALLWLGAEGLHAEPLNALHFDLNKDLVLDGDELKVFAAHKANPALDDIDNAPADGVISPEEARAFYADASKKAEQKLAGLRKRAIAAGGAIRVENLIIAPEDEEGSPCKSSQDLFIRRDRFDISTYASSLEAKGAAAGASLKLTNDLHGKSTGAIEGLASYVIRDPCIDPPAEGGTYMSGYVIAPWVLASGTLFDTSTASQKNKLQVGVDTQIEVAGGLFPYQYFTAAPYFQTDFDGEARIYGGQATWTPYNIAWKLGGATRENTFFDYFWQLQALADIRYVDNPGNSGLAANQAYAWLGGQVAINGWILPGKWEDKVFAKASYAYYWDAVSTSSVDLLTASVGVNLTEDKSTSISLDFAMGTDKDTLKSKDGLLLSLNYKQ